MEFLVLGPLRVLADGGEVEVRGVKERTLLAHLVAQAGRVVPIGDLIESLWGDDPPRTATKSLQTYVLRLRNALEPARSGEPRLLLTHGGGYRLAITEHHTDAGRFVDLVELARQALADGRAEAASEAAADALALWRGPAYAGVEGTTFGRAEAGRLSELRVSAEGLRLEAMLALGRDAAVVAELERLVEAHPLRERLWELLVVALYRSGQQGRALEAYDRARAVLADELGVDPGAPLRDLHARVLAQDPTLDLPRRAVELPSTLQPPQGPVLGRDAELVRLREAWARTAAGASTCVLLRGPTGAGATTLAAVLAEEVARAGHAVVVDGQPAPAAGPWLRVVEGPARGERGAMVLALGRPSSPPGDASTVLDLAPLPADDVRRLVAGHADPGEVDGITARVLGSGAAWPGRVHTEAARLAREAAARSLAVAVAAARESSAALSSARTQVSASLVALGDDPAAPPPEPGVCPWRGLAPYEVGDAAWFSGREHLVAELLARLASSRLLALVGASGSGKSSVLRAGVLAALAGDALPGSAGWRHVVMRPGRHPMRELARAALGSRGGDVGDLLATLVREEDGEQRALLVVDQMEEVWTACTDEGERAAFLDTLVEVAADSRSRTSVVVAIRADYVDEAAEHPALARLMADGTVLVGSPTSAELTRAVTRPAARAGLALEEGLPETIAHDAGTEPGLLPLLSVALTQAWSHRDGDRLTYAAYVASGGISGAIGTLAERVWEVLTEPEQTAARVLMLRLSGPGEGAGVVRRRVPLAELEALVQPGLRQVVERLAGARLVTVGDGHVEVAHEALFREWPRLRAWLSDDAAGRAVQRRLALAASEWDAEGRDPAALWRGTRLLAAVDVAASRPEEVTLVERAFLDAGLAAAEAEAVAVRERAESVARQNRRLRWVLVALTVFLVLALVAGALALAARSQAQESAAEADRSARRADARALAADALNEDRPALALLQAVEATRRDAAPETYGALLTLLTRTPEVLARYRIEDRFLRIASSADGATVYLSDNGETLRAVDTETAELRWEADSPGGDAQWGTAVADPRGRWVAVPVLGQPGATALAILDPATGAVVREVDGAALERAAPGGSPWLDERAHVLGDHVVVTTETHLFVVDPGTGDVVRARRLPAHSPFSLRLPDGIGFAAEPGSTVVVDLRGGGARTEPGALVGVSQDGRRLLTSTTVTSAAGSETSRLQVRDARWRRVGDPWQVPGYVRGAVFPPGGREVAVAVDEALHVFDVDSGRPVRQVDAHSGALLQMVLSGPDHDLIWTAGRDGTAVALDTTGERGLLRRLPRDVPADTAAAAGGVALVTNLEETDLNTLSVVDLETREDRFGAFQPVTSCTCQPGQTALSDDGTVGAVAIIEFTDDFAPVTDHGRVAVLDPGTGEVVRVIETPWPAAGLAVSPDGHHVLVDGAGGWGMWDLRDGHEVWAQADDLDVTWAPGAPLVGFSADGRRAALAREESVVLLDTATGEELRRAELPGSMVPGRLVFDATGETLVVGTFAGRLHFLDADTLERVAPDRLVTAGFVLDARLSPDGSVLAVMGTDGDVTLFDPTTWKPYGKPVVDKLGWGFLDFTDDGTLRIHGELGPDYALDTDPDAWVAAACRAANTRFTAEESAVVLPGEPVRPTCD